MSEYSDRLNDERKHWLERASARLLEDRLRDADRVEQAKRLFVEQKRREFYASGVGGAFQPADAIEEFWRVWRW